MSHLKTITSNATTVDKIRKTLIFFICLYFFSEFINYIWYLHPSVEIYLIVLRIVTPLVLLYAFTFGRLFKFDPRELVVEFDNFSFIQSMINVNMYPVHQFSRTQIIDYSFKKGLLYNTMIITRRKSDREDIVIRVKFPASSEMQEILSAQLAEIIEYNKNNPDPFVKTT